MSIVFTKVSAEPVETAIDAFEESERYYLASLVEIISNRESSLAFAPVYRSLAHLYETQGRYRTANILRREIIRIHEIEYGPLHPMVALDLCDLAISCRLSKETYLANQFYRRGIKLLFGCLNRLLKLQGKEPFPISEKLKNVLSLEDQHRTAFGSQAAFIRSGDADDCILQLTTAIQLLICNRDINTRLPYSSDVIEEIMSGVNRVTQLTKDLKEQSAFRYSERVPA